jgi:plastocyanin
MRAVVLTLLIACESSSNVPIDAPPDVPVVPVVTLSSCPSAVEATVQDSPTTFVPKETKIPKGGTVKFEITGEHFVLPNTLTTTDQMLSVKRGETKCFRFNVTGTYGFLCGAHGFTGTIVVQ